ncbi:MAG TPA: chemotaxis-specific protein-glutamate methyltransferase CheB [Chthoniobacterales bacterium]
MRIGIVDGLRSAVDSLRELLTASAVHEIAWTAGTAAEAVERCRDDPPDLVLMQSLDGAETTRSIMKRTPCRVLILTELAGKDSPAVLEALRAGAIDAVNFPVHPGSRQTGKALLERIAQIGHLTNRRGSMPEELKPGPIVTKLVAIGASAGGSTALSAILSSLPRHFEPAVVIVQHIEARFAPDFVQYLNEHSPLPVKLAREGDSLTAGTILVAATGDHLVFKSPHRIGYTAAPREHSYRPSVDVFFDSTVRHFTGSVVGVLLTGMGRDGAQGLKHLRDAGYHTIAQDQQTSTVYGMPKAAAELGAATDILPLGKIGPRLRQLFLR